MSDSKPFKPVKPKEHIIKDAINVNHFDRISMQKVRLLNPENEFVGRISASIDILHNTILDNCTTTTVSGNVKLSSIVNNLYNLSSNVDIRFEKDEKDIQYLKDISTRSLFYRGQLQKPEPFDDRSFSCLFLFNKTRLELGDVLSSGFVFTLNSQPIEIEGQRVDKSDLIIINKTIGISSISKEQIDIIDSFNYDQLSSLSSDTIRRITDLSNEISSKHYSSVYVKDEKSEGYTNLSVVKLTDEEYQKLIAKGETLSNTIYITSSDYIECYDQVAKNLTMTVDATPSEAATEHYVDNKVKQLSSEIKNCLSTSINIPQISGICSMEIEDIKIEQLAIALRFILSSFGSK